MVLIRKDMKINKVKGDFMNRFTDRYSKLLYHLFYEDNWCSLTVLSKKLVIRKAHYGGIYCI